MALAAALLLTACGAEGRQTAAPQETVTVTNCGAAAQFPSPASRMLVTDGNLIAMMLAIGAQDAVTAVTRLSRDVETLRRYYGPAVDQLREVSPNYPSRETILAQSPDVMVAGWVSGYKQADGITPDAMRDAGIAPYVLTDSCLQQDGAARGRVEPWAALREDLTNLGAITGRPAQAQEVVADIDRRLTALRNVPQSADPPTIFLVDGVTNGVFSSGRFGAPEAIITAGGGRNALNDVADTWIEVSWERVAASNPDAFLFVDYPPQAFEEKVGALRAREGINQLPAVVEGRFLNLPYALWTSGPLNIDAAEQVRKALERWQLVPPSTIEPRFDDEPARQ
jgi:iron complex transport system substrate-binding protein